MEVVELEHAETNKTFNDLNSGDVFYWDNKLAMKIVPMLTIATKEDVNAAFLISGLAFLVFIGEVVRVPYRAKVQIFRKENS